jgi:hypothetical protein
VIPDEALLVSNLLEALDRLYDQQTTVKDLHALLQASAVALGDTRLGSALLHASDAVGEILMTQRTELENNFDALLATDPLRRLVAAY